MITDRDLKISSESYLHKDFYNLYPEILELVTKITERWDPASSNESDPGVVLLKLLAFIADKNNYNIDKNILEAFMPSATQEDSMRKLCEMLGYNMKYYRSATTDVSFMWVGNGKSAETGENLPNVPNSTQYIKLDMFTELTDDSGEINYVLTEPVTLTYIGETVTKTAIQGTVQELEINTDNVVRLVNLDDNNRLYLPESQIAENGIWIWNVTDDDRTIKYWQKVDNLNIQEINKQVWKFGFDSRKRLPYISFPADIDELIKDGLKVKYIRTAGESGNINADTLTKLTKMSEVPFINNGEETTLPIEEEGDKYLVIKNSSYTLNGTDAETLDDAYNGFKKTIGTFETLVTCRDYANKIYQMVSTDINNTNLVSNVQVSDIKDDINFVNKIVSFDDYGMFYSDIPLKIKPVQVVTELPETGSNNTLYYCNKEYYEYVLGRWVNHSSSEVNAINNFDLYIYPLKQVSSFFKSENYDRSFKPEYGSTLDILNQLEDYKTISHIINQVSSESNTQDIYNIKNYYHLNAKISTTYKVTQYEASQILQNIYYALWKNFNSRKLDYGEEIPYDLILDTIQKADTRIKVVSLDEPKIKTNVMYGDGREINILDWEGKTTSDPNNVKVFYTLLAKNVLAGRIPLFNYDKRFKYTIGEKNIDPSSNAIIGKKYTYPTPDPTPSGNTEYSITAISTEVKIPKAKTTVSGGYTLKENELITLITPNLQTVKEGLYSCYVNYFFHRQNGTTTPARACSFTQITGANQDAMFMCIPALIEQITLNNSTEFNAKKSSLATGKNIWYKVEGTDNYRITASFRSSTTTYYITKDLNSDNWRNLWHADFGTNTSIENRIYHVQDTSTIYTAGRLIGNDCKFQYSSAFNSPLITLYACLTAEMKSKIYEKTGVDLGDADFEGQDATGNTIPANTEYQLDQGDVLCINYTDSNDVVHNIEYLYSNSKYIKKDDTGSGFATVTEFSGIIKPSFDLMDSEVQHTIGYGKNYSKVNGYSFVDYIVPGMFALQGTDQIEIRDYVKTTIKTSPFKCYWSTNTNKLIFNKRNINYGDSSGQLYEYECVLNNNEYFFYTDNLENSLVTLGSGTSLVLHTTDGTSDKITLTLDDVIDLEDISLKGIGAFSDTSWITLKLSESYFLDIIENQIISLSEGDTISGVKELHHCWEYDTADTNYISNSWLSLSPQLNDTFSYNGVALPSTVNNANWKIRSFLNLNMSENEGQNMIYDSDTTNPVVQKIQLYTSAWEVSEGEWSRDPNKAGLENLTEVHKPLITFTSQDKSDNYKIKSNYPVVELGGEMISTHRFTIDELLQDDLVMYRYQEAGLTYVDGSGHTQTVNQVSMYDDHYYKMTLQNRQEIQIPVFIPKNCFGLMMMYYTPSNQSLTTYPTVYFDTPNSLYDISYYKNNYDGQHWEQKVQLVPGINILRLQQPGGTLIIDNRGLESGAGLIDSGSIVISEIDIVNFDSETNITGVNYKLLNIPVNDCVPFIRDYLLNTKVDTDNIFYFNNPINKYNELDVNIIDQYSFFSYNNICNKFVISQLDSDFSDIQIAKSSRSIKW